MGRLPRPVAGADSLGRVDRLDAPLGRPVVLEGGAGREVAPDLVKRHHSADFVRKQLITDALRGKKMIVKVRGKLWAK